MEDTMTFYKALPLLLDGSKIRKTSWESGGYIMMDSYGYFIYDDGDEYIIDKQDFNVEWSVYDK